MATQNLLQLPLPCGGDGSQGLSSRGLNPTPTTISEGWDKVPIFMWTSGSLSKDQALIWPPDSVLQSTQCPPRMFYQSMGDSLSPQSTNVGLAKWGGTRRSRSLKGPNRHFKATAEDTTTARSTITASSMPPLIPHEGHHH